jgi:hypothetical protein
VTHPPIEKPAVVGGGQRDALDTASYRLPAAAATAGRASSPKIDPEFRSLIPLLGDDERDLLERNIIAHGCRDPLVIWKGQNILLDGHNRFAICQRRNVTYYTVEIELPDRASARVWIIRNQLGRRNLNESQRAMLAAKLATLAKGDNQHTAIAASSQAEAAELVNVSVDSVQRARRVLADGAPELVRAVEDGNVAVSAAAEISTLPVQEQQEVVEAGKKAIIAKAKAVKHQRRQRPDRGNAKETTKIIDCLNDYIYLLKDFAKVKPIQRRAIAALDTARAAQAATQRLIECWEEQLSGGAR